MVPTLPTDTENCTELAQLGCQSPQANQGHVRPLHETDFHRETDSHSITGLTQEEGSIPGTVLPTGGREPPFVMPAPWDFWDPL